ncbi:MAG: biotin synthase BioB [Deltaproteobacteria bacterium]|nr:biotin synthase BioB [Deltaproteobacteria bacterium]MBI3293192.1 biotin synthase BioB [Deltaproteobacteria bacterium]
MAIRHDWTAPEAFTILTSPLTDLLKHANEIHREFADHDVQQCELLSVKTGACPEDCGYCSQSAHVKTDITMEPLMEPEKVIAAAKSAKERGATRFCMGAAWRDVPSDRRFETVLSMIRGVAATGLEVCCTMGMATEAQLRRMKTAGLHSYNHNLDTSREHYPKVTTTRTYDDRLETLQAARRAGVALCCGGILGLGETVNDRAAMLTELARMNPHPESVPINLLVPVENTPMQTFAPVPFEEFLRAIASARIMLPRARVRLSAGRNSLTQEQQLACFYAGANSIFIGDKLLTTPNVEWESDRSLLRLYETDEIRATD